MKKIRWGIVGAARVNERLIPAINQSELGELIAIGSRRRGAAKDCLLKYLPESEDKVSCFDGLDQVINHESVDAYIKDPLCGFVPTNQMYEDLAGGVIKAFSQKQMQAMDSNLPILLIAGTKDPVGENGKGVEALNTFLTKYNQSVQLVLLPELRHEILNEIKKDQALSSIVKFLTT